MDLPLSSPVRRGILVVAAFLVFIVLSYLGIRNAWADHDSELRTLQGYERAVRLEPTDFRNWYLLGRYWQYNVEDADSSRAIRAYNAALSLNPHDADIWADLGTAYESEGNVPAARDAYAHAKRAYPSSAEVSWRYGNFLLRQGELDSAFQEMRQAVEADSKRGGEALSRSLRAEPNIAAVLDRVLPPNSDSYLYAIVDQTADGHTDNALKVWARLTSLHPRISVRDSFPLVNALRRDNKFAEARQVWDQAVTLSGLTNLPGPAGSVLWDGGFESGVIGGGYAWNYPGGLQGVQISIDPHEKHSGSHSLQLLFNGKFNVNLGGPCHDVPIDPSTAYQFSAWVRTQALTTDQGIRFQLRALGAPGSAPTVTSDVHGTQPWVRLAIPWSSGATDREMQVCVARSQSREADDKIQGIAWVDDVALVPDAGGLSKP
ncbi:MAG TPA: tetratricopeptide repeat protein [Candidatus Angelobacter sp.]|nr:tetratricopeptide repeat protein [Candidatus Angelobacter sp.]